MEEKVSKAQSDKPSYEQLEKEINGLKGMNNQLIIQLQQINMQNLFKRLDYLFNVLKFKESFSVEFVDKCSKEIENYLTLPEAEEPDSSN